MQVEGVPENIRGEGAGEDVSGMNYNYVIELFFLMSIIMKL
jgi:hypothetical protein